MRAASSLGIAIVLLSLLPACAGGGGGAAATSTQGGSVGPGSGGVGSSTGGTSSGGAGSSAGGSTTGGSTTGGSSTGGGGSTPPPQPPAVPQIPAATLTQIGAAIDAALADPGVAGRTVTLLAVDDESGQEICARHADLPLVPASNTKLYTTAAAISLLGEDHRMTTRVASSAAIDGSGRVTGNLYLFSENDFTFSTAFYPSARFPFDQLVDRLYRAGLRSVSGGLVVSGAYCYDGDALGTYDAAAHRARAQAAFLAALAARGITVAGASSNVATMALPAGVVPLVEWRSIPLHVACATINHVSHNEMADTLCQHLGWVMRGTSDYPTGAAVVMDWLSGLGVGTSGASLNDGSGLSLANRFTARQMVGLIRAMERRPEADAWNATLSIAGVEGTLAGRMTGADTIGRFYGKSGTNDGIATSGFLINKHDGRKYVIGVLMNNIAGTAYAAARSVEDRCVEALAGDLRRSGARPAVPRLAYALNDGNGRTVTVRWDAVAGAVGYQVAYSLDGKVWDRGARFYTTSTTYVVSGFAPPETACFRVSAVNAAGESDPSNAYAVRCDARPSAVLVVDANLRWQREASSPENVRGAAHAFALAYAPAITRTPFDTCSRAEVEAGVVSLSGYDAVIWACGQDGLVDGTFGASARSIVSSYLAGGGNLLASGSEIAWDLDRPAQTDAGARAFCEQTLHATYAADSAQTFLVRGSGGILAGLPISDFFSPGGMIVTYPDVIVPSGGATGCLEYVGGTGGAAAVQYSGSYRLVGLGFPLEAIDAGVDRAAVIDAALQFFGL